MFQRGLNKNGEDYKVVDPATKIEEWTELGGKCKGPKKGGKAHGICRKVESKRILLMQKKDNQQHGLTIAWHESGNIGVGLLKNGKCLGHIEWSTKDWTEVKSNNKWAFELAGISIDDFRP